MDKEDIIRMARESNLMSVKFSTALEEMWVGQLERFANLVAAAEREACAKICDAEAKEWIEVVVWGDDFANELAAAIRARGQG
jgi:hypothetical protein